jgi:hypothetical protein
MDIPRCAIIISPENFKWRLVFPQLKKKPKRVSAYGNILITGNWKKQAFIKTARETVSGLIGTAMGTRPRALPIEMEIFTGIGFYTIRAQKFPERRFM